MAKQDKRSNGSGLFWRALKFLGLSTVTGWVALLVWFGFDAKWVEKTVTREWAMNALIITCALAALSVSLTLLSHYISERKRTRRRRVLLRKYPDEVWPFGNDDPKTMYDIPEQAGILKQIRKLDMPRCSRCDRDLETVVPNGDYAYECPECHSLFGKGSEFSKYNQEATESLKREIRRL